MRTTNNLCRIERREHLRKVTKRTTVWLSVDFITIIHPFQEHPLPWSRYQVLLHSPFRMELMAWFESRTTTILQKDDHAYIEGGHAFAAYELAGCAESRICSYPNLSWECHDWRAGWDEAWMEYRGEASADFEP